MTSGQSSANSLRTNRWLSLTFLGLLVFLPTKPFGLGADVGSGGTHLGWPSLLAGAAYLDDVGQMSHVMSEFIELLLEKVTFLADIVIESSLDEECEASCALNASRRPNKSNSNNDYINNNPDSSSAGNRYLPNDEADTRKSSASNKGALNGKSGVAPAIELDESEFREPEFWANLWVTKGSSGAFNAATQNNGTQDAQRGSDGSQREQGCSLFGLSLAKHDLPVTEMEACCRELTECYSKCGNLKLTCDSNFRSCLRSMCKLKFDYNNDSLLRRGVLRWERDTSEGLSQYELLVDRPADGIRSDGPELDEEQLYGSLGGLKEPNNGHDGADSITYANSKPVDQVDRLLRRHTDGPTVADDASAPTRDEHASSTTASELIDQRKRLKDKYKACRLASKVLIIGNLAFTCRTYRRIQRSVCCTMQS